MRLKQTSVLLLFVVFTGACDSATAPGRHSTRSSLSLEFEGASLGDWSQPTLGTFQMNVGKDTNSDFARWYSFRVQAGQGESHIFRIMNAGTLSASDAFSVDRPVVSADGGVSWERISDVSFASGIFEFRHTPSSDDEWIALAPVYNFSRWEDLVSDIQDHAMVDSLEVIAQSLEGRPIHLVKITDPSVPDTEKGGIWAIARQHPAQAGGSWMAEGMLQWLLGSSAQAVELRRQATIYLVPFMNPDGVVLGNYLTNSAGADLNQEWSNRSAATAPSVAAVADLIEDYVASGRSLDFFVDFHAHPSHRKNFFYYSGPGQASEEEVLKTEALMSLFQRSNGDFTREGSEAATDDATVARGWVFENFGVQAVTFECSFQDVTYLPNLGQYMTVDRYLALGEGLGQSLAEEFFGISGG